MLTFCKTSVPLSRTLFHISPSIFAFASSKRPQSSKADKPHLVNLHEPNLNDLMLSKTDFSEGVFDDSRGKSSLKRTINKLKMPSFDQKNFREIVRDISELAMYPDSLEQSGVLPSQIVSVINQNLSQISLDNVGTLVRALSRIGFFPEQIQDECKKVILKEITNFEPSEIAIILWSFAKIKLNDPEFWQLFIPQVEKQLPKMSLLDITQVVWALSSIHYRDSKIWNDLEDVIMKFKNLSSGQAISLFMMNFAKMNLGSEDLWRNLESRFLALSGTLEPQSITNGLWALGKRGKMVVVTGAVLESLVTENFYKLNDLEAGSAAWTVVKLTHGSRKFWEAVQNRALSMLNLSPDKVDLLTLCSFTWVLKSANDLNDNFWTKLEYHLLEKIDQIQGNHLYSILAGFAVKKRGSVVFWKAFNKKAISLMEQFTPKDLSIMIWAFATAEKGYTELWQLAAEYLNKNVADMNAQDLVISLWGLAKSRKIYKPEILETVLIHLNELFDEMKPVDVGLVMYSLGKILHKSNTTRELYRKVRHKLIHESSEMQMIDIIHSCYSISALKMGDEELWDMFESIFTNRYEEIHEEGWALIMICGAEGAEFSEKFWQFAENQIKLNLSEYSGPAIATIMGAVNKRRYGSIELWTLFEEEIKKKMPLLDDNTLADCAYIMMKRNISQNEFWISLESVIINRLHEIKLGALSKLIQSFGLGKRGSLELWMKFQKILKIKFIEEQYITKQVLLCVLFGFSSRKKGDHDFWNLLDKRIMDVLKQEEVTPAELASVVKKLAKVKRGSRKLWASFFEVFISNLNNAHVPTVLNASEGFISVKEIDETEKEMLQKICVDKVLESDEEFSRYLYQLSSCFHLCQKLPSDDMKRISQKIDVQSRRAVDSEVAAKMNYSLNKIIKNQELAKDIKQEKKQEPPNMSNFI